jgi:hypothetical protein
VRKTIGIVALIVLFLIILTACGQTEEEQGSVELVDELTAIEVELDIPEFAEIGEAVTFNSIVTHGDDLVEDANEVIYEIWLDGQKEASIMVEADAQEGHIYSLDYTFEEAGVYHVQTHVTARGMHRMPTEQIQIGEEEITADHSHSHDQQHDDNHAHHHHHNDVDIDTELKNDRLVVQIVVEGDKYESGNVTFEMWQEEGEQRDWLDLFEVGNGVYELRDIEGLSGQYSVIVHIQDEELHEHVNMTLDF